MPEKSMGPRKPPSRAAYALPTLFTAGNIFLGFLSIIRTIHGSLSYASNPTQTFIDFEFAAKAIGLAVVLDGLDGRVARMTHTTSEFGRELDSLADIISFGIAPAILAYMWGVNFVSDSFITTTLGAWSNDQLPRVGTFVAFLFLVCGAGRLARFNIQKNPVPRNPGAPNRKYFVGLPIPAAAALVAAIVYASSAPLVDFVQSAIWLAIIALLAFLMVSTWRYWSFKELNLMRPRSPLIVIAMAAVIYTAWNWSHLTLLALTVSYVASGIIIRIGGIARRLSRRSKPTPTPAPETQIG